MGSEQNFHWAEGMKYALEGIKALFVLNGAATVSILTFIGNSNRQSEFLVYSMAAYAVGALMGPVTLLLAYLTQLMYGNASLEPNGLAKIWIRAGKFHYATYGGVIFGVMLFMIGTILAAKGLLNSHPLPVVG